MRVTVKYFAIIREYARLDAESWDVPAATTGRELFARLAGKYKIPLQSDQTLIAINDSYASLDHALSPDDEIVFMPPLAGG